MDQQIPFLQLLEWTWAYARRFPLQLASVLSMMGMSILLSLVKPWPMVFLIDYVLRGQSMPPWLAGFFGLLTGSHSQLNYLGWTVAAIFLIFFLDWACGIGTKYADVTLGQRITYAVAADTLSRLQQFSPLLHLGFTTGDKVRRVTTDAGCVTTIFRDALLPVVGSVVTLILMLTVMWQVSVVLTCLAVLVIPYMTLMFRLYARPMLDRGYREQDAEGRIYTVVEQTFSGLPAVKAFGREKLNEELLRQTTERTVTAAVSSLSVQLQFKFLIQLATAVGTAGIFWFGANSVMRGEMTVGAIVLFISYLASLYAPIEAIMYTGSTVQNAAGSARRILEILRTPPGVIDKPNAAPLRSANGHVQFENVSFNYVEGQPVLRNVSLSVEAGETIALVGPTGAGKSTLVSLVPRFFDPTEGRVLIDGQDLRDVQLASLRSQVALVLQEPFLFPLTVAENIAYGRPDASRTEIEAAARAAKADEFICRLPQGYDTVLGERGANLSGGERQRLTIARALLKDAPILILDEPTTALDAATEALILEAVRALIRGRTTFIIAHRLATVQHADRIVVLQDGAVVESGTHHQLVRQNGLYRRYASLQLIPTGQLP
jgi:ATP-binding cassette subfamily B protein/subfamily B ATP-binding cassette protein MsbA